MKKWMGSMGKLLSGPSKNTLPELFSVDVPRLPDTTEKFEDKHLLYSHRGIDGHKDFKPYVSERGDKRWQSQPKIPANTLVLPYKGEQGEKVAEAVNRTIDSALNSKNYTKFYVVLFRGVHYDKAMTVYKDGQHTAEHVVYFLYEKDIGFVHYERPSGLKEGIPILQPQMTPTIHVSPDGSAEVKN